MGFPEKGFAPTALPGDTTSYWLTSNQPYGNPTMGFGISEKCKYKEEALKFIDYINSWEGMELVLNGIKGVHWDVYDGVPYQTPERTAAAMQDPEYASKQGIGSLTEIIIMGMGTQTKLYDGTTLEYPERPDTRETPAAVLSMLDFYKLNAPIELVTKNTNLKAYAADWPAFDALELPDDDWQAKIDHVDNYIYTNYLPMILAKNDAEFEARQDEFIKGLIEAGYNEVQEWYRKGLAITQAEVEAERNR